MEENNQEESEISVCIQETPQTPTQTPLDDQYNDIVHTPTFQPFHPSILPITPASYIPHPGYTELSSSWTNIPIIPVHPAGTPLSHQNTDP
jgi:hypothetical protein